MSPFNKAPPGATHVAIAVAIQATVAAPAWSLARFGGDLLGLPVGLGSVGLAIGATAGALVAFGFYLGRERRQSEEWAGSNRIPPWVWKPRALRDLGTPTAVVAAIAAGAWAWAAAA